MTDRARELRDALRLLLVAQQVMDDTRRPCGARMPMPRVHALLELLRSNGPMTVTMLASKLNIDRTNVSRLCARMEADGELVRESRADDARARALRLTAKGEALAEHVDRSSARHFDRVLAHLGADGDRVLAAMVRFGEAIEVASAAQGEAP